MIRSNPIAALAGIAAVGSFFLPSLQSSPDSAHAVTTPVETPVERSATGEKIAALRESLPGDFEFRQETENLDPELRYRVTRLLLDPEAKGRITLSSAYRSKEKQQQLYDCFVKNINGCLPANPPGMSKHEKGLAVDLSGPHALRLRLATKYGLYNSIKRADGKEDHHFELAPDRGPVPK